MTDEQHDEAAVSEQAEVKQTEEHVEETQQEEQKMVPLAALQAERKKRQELETRARVYEEMMNKKQEPEEEEEDPDSLVTKAALYQERGMTKREILEQVYQDVNPHAVEKINLYLKPILDKKPWLASTIDTAVNRLARANEIVDDYMHLLQEKPKAKAANDAARIVENAQKPRSPAEIGKSAQPTGIEFLKSIQGKAEFREYRKKVLSGEA